MYNCVRHALLIAILGALACSRGEDEPGRAINTTSADDTIPAAKTDTAGGHALHEPAAETSPKHQQHGTASGREHGGQPHAAARHAGEQHRAAGAARHVAHAPAAHAQRHPTTDTTRAHAGHPQSIDSMAHPEHQQHRDTTRHAGHQPAADTTRAHDQHAAHADTTIQHAAHADTTTQHPAHAGPTPQHGHHGVTHNMPMLDLGGGIMVIGMAQAFPTFTFAVPGDDGTALGKTGFYLTQPALMANIEGPGSRIVLRTTLNFEGLTQRDGELTFGGWGEGFLDKRHPHTLLHEFMLSANFFRGSNSFSLSLGKGFAPYGTDDPMSRPIVKYPTNHHLSQALERWTVNGIAQIGQWSVEAGIFGGAEPTDPYDFSNIESFADSWSARLTRRFGMESMGAWPWELSISHAYIEEVHHDEVASTRLYNAAVRHERNHGPTRMYALLEAAFSEPQHFEGFYSVLAEGALAVGPHKPYARIEYATRPEYERLGAPGTEDFFRYHHDDEPIGATRWLIVTGGYGFTAIGNSSSLRPYIEAQYNHVDGERGSIDPQQLFGRSRFWSISLGARIFLGGEAMRMGTYGVLDAMTRMHKPMMTTSAAQQHH